MQIPINGLKLAQFLGQPCGFCACLAPQNFTMLAGVALSDQMEDGAGQLGLLRGAHHVIERVYQQQAAAGCAEWIHGCALPTTARGTIC